METTTTSGQDTSSGSTSKDQPKTRKPRTKKAPVVNTEQPPKTQRKRKSPDSAVTQAPPAKRQTRKKQEELTLESVNELLNQHIAVFMQFTKEVDDEFQELRTEFLHNKHGILPKFS